MQRRLNQTRIRIISAVVLVAASVIQFVPATASATPQLLQAYIRLDRMMSGTTDTGGSICAKPSTVAGIANVKVIFPATYTIDSTAGHWATDTVNIPTGTSAWPSMGAATPNNATHTVVWSAPGTVDNTHVWCFHFSGSSGSHSLQTAAASNDNQQASIETQNGSSVAIEHTDVALSNYAQDTVNVTAVVPPTFLFHLSANVDPFTANLDPAAVGHTAGAVSVTVTTNAKGGWIAWASDSQQGLHSTAASYTIHGTPNSPSAGDNTANGAPTTVVAGTENYVMDVNAGSNGGGTCATITPDPEFNGVAASSGGTFAAAGFVPIASCGPGTANLHTFTIEEYAAISGATPAASDYSDIITIIGAGNF